MFGNKKSNDECYEHLTVITFACTLTRSSSLQAEELIGLVDDDDSKKCVAKVSSLSQTVSHTDDWLVTIE